MIHFLIGLGVGIIVGVSGVIGVLIGIGEVTAYEMRARDAEDENPLAGYGSGAQR